MRVPGLRAPRGRHCGEDVRQGREPGPAAGEAEGQCDGPNPQLSPLRPVGKCVGTPWAAAAKGCRRGLTVCRATGRDGPFITNMQAVVRQRPQQAAAGAPVTADDGPAVPEVFEGMQARAPGSRRTRSAPFVVPCPTLRSSSLPCWAAPSPRLSRHVFSIRSTDYFAACCCVSDPTARSCS